MKKIIPILVASGALVGGSAIATACNQTTVERPVQPFEPSPEYEELQSKDPLYLQVRELVKEEINGYTKEQLTEYAFKLYDAYIENTLRIQLNSNENYNLLVKDLLNTKISEIKVLLSQIG